MVLKEDHHHLIRKNRSYLSRSTWKEIFYYGDVTDAISVSAIIKKVQPSEIYNLAAQSHVAVSFEVPEYTANADAIGTLRILESIKFHGLENKTKFYQAGTSEMLEKFKPPHKTKNSILSKSPYVAKVYALDNC